MKHINFKNNKGFTGADVLISILIITLFTGIVATLIYNIYITATKTKRASQATAYIVEIFEHVDKMYYSDVTEENLTEYIRYKYNNAENSNTDNTISNINIASARNVTGVTNTNDTSTILTTPYKIEISIESYNVELDLVKTVTVTVKYNVGQKEEKITISKVKSKENLITPNEPDLLSNTLTGGTIYPIKYNNETWYVTNNKTDTTWYNYENKTWAVVFVSTANLAEGDAITEEIQGNYYIWVPRYAYNNSNISDIKFLYKETNDFVNENENLETINTEAYTIANGGWIQAVDMQNSSIYSEYVTLRNTIGANNI